MKIAVAGTGYVGLSNALLLSKNNEVVAIDIISDKVEMLNKGISPIQDSYIEQYLLHHKEKFTLDPNKQIRDGSFSATNDKEKAYKNASYVVIATPTNYDEERNTFDTSSVESVIEDVLNINEDAYIIIKSTIPVGYTESIKKKYNNQNIVFSPEFLREGLALYDNLYPSRIIIGEDSKRAKDFAELLVEGALKKDIKILMMDSTEAEAVKLFSNSYLGMRIAYFNELDSYAEKYNLSSKNIIEGMGFDSRIGLHYNNPSFGYGGYCLPKDTKQLKANFDKLPHALISAIVDSNKIRKEFIVNSIIKKNPRVIGVHRLVMKTDSDNLRDSAVLDIIKILKSQFKNIKVIIYEPILSRGGHKELMGYKILDNINEFKERSNLIIANRFSDELRDVENKVYTRDLYNSN